MAAQASTIAMGKTIFLTSISFRPFLFLNWDFLEARSNE
jgi:hypothetical protein